MMDSTPRVPTIICCVIICAVLVAWSPGVGVRAEAPYELQDDDAYVPDGIHVLDGSYVLDAGELRVHITNHGLIGSRFSEPTPFSYAPSGQWPGGSGDEYLYAAGLWIGARVAGQISVSTGQPLRELRPGTHIYETIYEARNALVTRPTEALDTNGYGLPSDLADDDRDGLIDEEILNGVDDDGDGRVDEDFAQIGNQMLVCTMSDDTDLARESYPDHRPLGALVVQRAASWENETDQNMAAFEYEITNRSGLTWENAYLGFYVDCDIRNRADGVSAPDDLTGYFDGAVRDEFGSFHRLQVGWMRDAADSKPLPGVFGVMIMDHTTDYSGTFAPSVARTATYQSFAASAAASQEGEPLVDLDRYAAMSAKYADPDAEEDEKNDYKFMVSCGPFPRVPAGRTLEMQLAMVVGEGMSGMLESALAASIIQRGGYIDLDADPETGIDSKETKVCLGDIPADVFGQEIIFLRRSAFMDESCTGSRPVFGVPYVIPEDLFLDEDDRWCVYVNADNCEECFRAAGQHCTEENGLFWSARNTFFTVTGTNGREHHVRWWRGDEHPPPAPRMRVVPGDHQVEIFWDDRSEHEPDMVREVPDFESYRLWRVVNWKRPEGVTEENPPPSDLWSLIGEWDLVNEIPPGINPTYPNGTPLGRNTGLEGIRYTPDCLDDPAYEGLAEAMQGIVDADPRGKVLALPPLRYPDGTPRPFFASLLPWEHAPAVLDTFFAVTAREADPVTGVVAKRASRYCHFLDTSVHNGFTVYYSVTARDHRLARGQWLWEEMRWQWGVAGYGVEFEPSYNFAMVMPRADAQTPAQRASHGANVYVYPNPVTRASLADFDLQYPTSNNPTGGRVVIANLPTGRNRICIYTLAGDLVDVIKHDSAVDGGAAIWDLLSRNGQEIASGVYLFSVESQDDSFENVVGRFTVVW